jgi:rod shape determining protein RodA
MIVRIFKMDWILILAILLLLSLSLIIMYGFMVNNSAVQSNMFSKHLTIAIISFLILVFFIFFDHQNLKPYATAIYFITLILLILVIIFGSRIRGTVGWIGLGSFHIQPVEIAKAALIIFLAAFFSKKKSQLGDITRIIVSMMLTFFMVFLVLRQPDMGSSIILCGIWLGMILMSGLNKKHFFVILTLGLLVAFIGWNFLAPYQKDRINNLINPSLDIKGSGYNAKQAVVAVGSGGLFGNGIGQGTQSQLNFLPEKHTDFVFAVITEELGFVGALFLFFIFAVIFYRMKKIAQKTQDNFSYLMVSGVIIVTFLEVFINVGMNIQLMPITGIPLPFLSYGGSSLVVHCFMIGIALNINAKKNNIINNNLANS